MKPCWSCGTTSTCFDDCKCAKCIDPIGYEEWKQDCPDEYEKWLESQIEDDFE